MNDIQLLEQIAEHMKIMIEEATNTIEYFNRQAQKSIDDIKEIREKTEAIINENRNKK